MPHYQLHKQPKVSRLKKYTIVGAVIFIVVVCAIAYALFTTTSADKKQSTTQSASAKKEVVLAQDIHSKLLFMGDTYWGRYIHEWSQASNLKDAYPFSGLASFERPAYDAWIANLECPTVPGVSISSAQEDATLMFNCNPRYLDEAKKWFTAFSLANNHTDNQGASGFTETKKQLDARGIEYFGHYDPEVHTELCKVVAVDTDTKTQLPVALCGYHGVFKIPSEASLAVIKEYAQFMPVISMPHMGAEYKTASDPIREKTFRTMIDNGANTVIGGHPHWVQNTEAYKGKPIFYSVGNFIFDQQANKEVTRSASIAVTLTVPEASSIKANQWSSLLQTCTKDQTCLQQAKKQNLAKLPVQLTYDIVPGDSSSKLTKAASPEVSQSVLERLNWEVTKKQLTVQSSQ